MPVVLSNTTNKAFATSWNGSSFDDTTSYTVVAGTDVLSVRLGGVVKNPQTIEFNGVALLLRVEEGDTNSNKARIYDLVNPPIGTYDLYINTGGNGRSYVLSIASLSGVDTTSPVGDIDSAGGWGANRALTLTTAIDDFVIDLLVSQTATVGTGQVVQLLNVDESSASFEIAVGSSTTMGWSHAAFWSAIAAVVYQPSAGGSEIPLTGAAITLTTASGSITTSIPVEGAAATVSSANAGLSVSVNISGAAVAEAIATAAIAAGIDVSGDAIATAIASGGLSINLGLEGNAVAAASASANLSVSGAVSLLGDATATASASAQPSMAIPISGAAISTSGASGGLGAIFPLAGSGASVTTAVGALNIGFNLAANANAEALAAGDLKISFNVDGAAIAQAAASGTLNLGGEHRLPPSDRLEVIGYEERIESIRYENRVAV